MNKKNNWKKIMALACLTVFTAVTLFACGGSSDAPNEDASDDNSAPKSQGKLVIGCKAMGEQYILQEILAILVDEYTDLEVVKLEGIAGGSSNIQVAMENKDIDLYPEYTGTGWLTVLKNEPIDDADALFAQLNAQYNEAYDMSWIGLYGFNNSYALAVRKDTAEQYNLKTISDLAKISDQVVFGANFDYYEREDGYSALCEAYGLTFKDTAEVDMGLKYQALAEKQCDVVNAYTTDSQIKSYDLVILEDDRSFFFSDYYCSTIVRNEVLAQYPELKEVLMKMDGLITNEEMISMNYQMNDQHISERDIATEFLKNKGLIQ